jgi:hypothetical protein
LVGRIRIIQAFSIEIALPSDVAEQLSGVGLSLVPRQQSQARFDNLTLGPEAGGRHGFRHQRIVDLNVGAQPSAPLDV